MVSDWEEVVLGDYIDHQKGYIFKSKDYQDEGELIVRVSDFTDRSIDISSCNRIDKLRVDEFQSVTLNTHDVIIATVGSWPKNPASIVGKTVSVPKEAEGALLNQNAVRLRAINGVEQRFLFSLLKNKPFQSYIVSTAQGSANQASITLRDIFRYSFHLPPIKEQKAIAHILGSLDDKIELNRQMNETLEAMAQALFKSWFVDFDPVIDNALAAGNTIPDEFAERAKQRQAVEKTDLSDIHQLFPDAFKFTEEMGWIPKGWAVSDVGTEFNTVGGGTPSTKNPEFWEDGNISWTTPKDLSGNQSKILLHTDRKITELGLKKISSGLLPVDTVLMSSRAPVGYLALAKVPVAINQGYIALKCEKTLTPEFAIQWADSIMDEIKQRAGGTTFAEISKTNFRGIPVLVPSQNIIDVYSQNVKDLYSQITSRMENIDALSKLRDTLLPKLMSGELRIPDAAAMVEEA